MLKTKCLYFKMGDYISGVHKQPLSNPYCGLTLLIVHATKIFIFIKKKKTTKKKQKKTQINKC